MKIIEFPGCNRIYGANQPEYQPLPCIAMPDGQVIQCWELTTDEIETIIAERKIYVAQQTFNSPLQPISVAVNLEDLPQ